MNPVPSVALALSVVAVAGSLLLLCAAALMVRRGSRAASAFSSLEAPAVSVLKPLHGAEPRLRENLASVLHQDYGGAVQVVLGVGAADDGAAPVARALAAGDSPTPVTLVVGSPANGTNGKVRSLIALAGAARHDVLVIADSDMAVPPQYLARIARALAEPGVGAATCLYVGRGDAGLWSRLVAAWIDTHFLPQALIGTASGLAHPCMGSTIALTRETLVRIGGFERFADVLADDHAIGAAVRAAGLRVVVAPDLTLTHACRETSLGALLRQELRWNATLRGIDPWGYAGSAVLHPLPLALIALALGGGGLALAAVLLALGARALVAMAAATTGAPARAPRDRWLPLALVPARDLLAFLVFCLAFAARSVDWRGASFNLEADGRISRPQDG